MKPVVLLALAATLLGAQDIQKRGRQVIDEAIAALGGAKFLAVKNRVETGRAYSFYNRELSGLSVATFYTRYLDLPPGEAAKKVGEQQRQAFGKDEFYHVTLRDEGGWEVTYRGPTKLEQETIDRFRNSTFHNIFYILRMRLNEPGLEFDYKGNDVIENVPVTGVDVVDGDNRVVTVYFHQTTKLPVRQEWVWRDPKTRDRYVEVTRFNRYREYGGVLWPTQSSRERNGSKTFEMFAESVTFDAPLNDAVFAIPDANTRPAPVKR